MTKKHKITLRALLVATVLLAAFFTTGCTTINDSTIESATFNSAGWKSNAGGADQSIDATNDITARPQE